jgi:hypothetical protein
MLTNFFLGQLKFGREKRRLECNIKKDVSEVSCEDGS